MKAIRKLIDSGLTRKQIALTIGVSEQAIGMVARGQRWPSRSTFAGIVRLGEERGLVLLAKDFVTELPN
jgi:DNA-binding XRE family transcriptional regulator